jgi:hypothetical protein
MGDWMARNNAQDENVMCVNCCIRNHYSKMHWIEKWFDYLCELCFLDEESSND